MAMRKALEIYKKDQRMDKDTAKVIQYDVDDE